VTIRCARSFEVEALRDGRLSGRARDAFEEHLRTCIPCRAETRALDAVAENLRALPIATPDELSVRRRRHRLLAAFHEAPVAPASVAPRRPPAALAFAFASAVGVAAAVAIVHDRAPSSAPAASASAVEITSEGAAWSRTEAGASTNVRLDDGELEIHV